MKIYWFAKLLSPFIYPFRQVASFFEPIHQKLLLTNHSVHWGITPLQKHHPVFFSKPPLQPADCPSYPFLGNPFL